LTEFQAVHVQGQIPLRYPASEPARQLVRELDSVMKFGLSSSLAGR